MDYTIHLEKIMNPPKVTIERDKKPFEPFKVAIHFDEEEQVKKFIGEFEVDWVDVSESVVGTAIREALRKEGY